MKNKVVNLFDNAIILENKGVKYSELFEKFLQPFMDELKEIEFLEEIVEFGIVAWNFGNLKSILPEKETDSFINSLNDIPVKVDVLERMIDFKVSNFDQYDNFIIDFELTETDHDPLLKLITQPKESYLTNALDKIGNEDSEVQFKENYVNRYAIILKSLNPYIEWVNKLYPEDNVEESQVTTYLIDDQINDLEAWLAKKYDKLFTAELAGWSTNKKDWPQKRTYKMFKEWFRVEVSTLVYDLEKSPVLKVD